MKRRYDFIFKIVVVGDARVGKTYFVNRMTDSNDLNTEYYCPTHFIDAKFRTVEIVKNLVNARLHIHDTSSRSDWKDEIQSYVSSPAVVFAIFDLTNMASFTHLENWIQLANPNGTAATCIVGTKLDLCTENRAVDGVSAARWAKSIGAKYVELSTYDRAAVQTCVVESVRTSYDTEIPEGTILDEDELASKGIKASAGVHRKQRGRLRIQ